MKSKSCGNCQNFLKFKNNENITGLCDLLDCRTKSDYRPNCSYWKGIKYKRKNGGVAQPGRAFG